ncbi:MAG: amylo-alpha-1,6-glucosidase [Nitrospirae bacterium]|nr:amylo-alpha-1,6-glucosidase [Nitrospirota bacterium]
MTSIRTYTLKEGELFALLNPLGDILPSEVSPEQGLYADDTRFLSRLDMRIDGMIPGLLSSTIKKDNILFTADLSNPHLQKNNGRIEKNTIHIFRTFFLYNKNAYERLSLKNFNPTGITLKLEFFFDADYVDIFELRGTKRLQRGKKKPAMIEDSSVRFSYEGMDGLSRYTILHFTPAPDRLSAKSAEYILALGPDEERHIYITITIGYEKRMSLLHYDQAFQYLKEGIERIKSNTVTIRTSNEQFNDLLDRSKADICTLVTKTDVGLYPYAGIPWYSTIFGRDGIITALECLWTKPDVARGVLAFLSANQAKELDPENDAEPGKIPHEIRKGEMARTGEVPFEHYYGSVDATPLYILLAGEYLKRTGDIDLIDEIWENLKAALKWIKEYGDMDGDGFVEYSRHSQKGLINQGWKDSYNSVFHDSGALAEPPIALVEVQGYVYGACNHLIKIGRYLGDQEVVSIASSILSKLKKNFHKYFWSKKIGMYALALDGKKQPCEVRASNAGHTLFTGIAHKKAAKNMARLLLSERFFSGWGIRTIASGEALYNPMSYHNGSVWPHDNAIIGMGLSRYGYKKEVIKLLEGLFEASLYVELHRLPELFCGFIRRPGEGPTLYPVACQPQAWASGAVFLLLQACLGLSFEAETNSIIFKNPMLPDFIDYVEIDNLRLMESRVRLFLERYKDDVVVKVLDKEGDVRIVIYK